MMNPVEADAVWKNASIYTMNPTQPTAGSMAVKDGNILAIGDDASVQSFIGPRTREVDVGGRFILPGLLDCHIHGIWGSLRDLYEIYVGYTASLDTLLAEVVRRTENLPADKWITGGPWRMEQVERMTPTPRECLDQHAPNHPVALKDATLHSLWLNSRAIEISGLDSLDAAEYGTLIERDGSGRLTGLIHESACGPVRRFLKFDKQELNSAVLHMRNYLHSMGVTGCKEAMAGEQELSAYYDADAAGDLKLHLVTHIIRQSPLMASSNSTATMEDWARRYQGPHMQTRYAKLFLDGVAPSRTAAFLEPYKQCECCNPKSFNPDLLLRYAPDDLAEEVTLLDKHGFTVKMHAVGDRAVRAGLDAIERARQANGDSGLKHEIGHTAFVDATDFPRFKALGAVAEMSPKLWYPNAVTAGQIKMLGDERTQRCHPIRHLLDADALVVYGSDWPAAAPDANPWPGLAGMLTRQNLIDDFPGYVGRDQSISLQQALPLFTTNAARTMGLEQKTGSLQSGKSADFIVLEKSLFEQTPEEIAKTAVEATIFEGNIVFDRDMRWAS